MQPARNLFPTGPAAAFCAVGNPQSFFTELSQAGYDVVLQKTFADHHAYSQHDVDDLVRSATNAGATSLITTAKDAVKLRALSFSLPWHVLEIEIAIQNEDAFRQLILNVL
jgi:tetraacyldisaccharide 4'-kinase